MGLLLPKSLSQLASWSINPWAFAVRCAPSAMSTKSEFRRVGITRPIVWVVPEASALATLLREKPRSAITARTFSRVRSETRFGWLSTCETVPIETPARLATSGRVGRPDVLRALRLVLGTPGLY